MTQDPLRRRPIISHEAMADALLLAHQGKVSAKNAWDVKVLEGMQDTVTSVLADDGAADQYAQFSHFGNIVEGGAKVWSHRVENIYLLSTQTLSRMLRNNTRDEDAPGEGAEGDTAGAAQPRRRRRTLERTIAETLEEIDSKEPLGSNEAVSALFRAMTEKFDQSHAAGLLLNNAPYGKLGNIILERNEAEDEAATPALPLRQTQNQTERDAHTEEDGAATVVELPRPSVRAAAELPHVRPLPMDEPEIAPVPQRGTAFSRAASVSSAAHNVLSARPSIAQDGDDNDFGDFGDAEGYGDDPAVGDSQIPSRLGSIAKGLVSGQQELEEMDQLALEAENPREWVPLTAGKTAARSAALNTILRSAQIRSATQMADRTQQTQGTATRRGTKTVAFVASANFPAGVSVEPGTSAATLAEQLKMNRTLGTALTPLGKDLLSGSSITLENYADPTYCANVADSHSVLLTAAFESFNLRSSRRKSKLPATAASLLFSSHGRQLLAAEDLFNVRAFFQPTCTLKDSWNVLSKTASDSAFGGTRLHHTRYDAPDQELPVAGPELVGEMPVDLFDGGADFGNDGPDDDDAPLFNIPPPMVDLAELNGPLDADQQPTLIQGPEIVQALKLNRASVPTMVDVAKLRRTMWRSLSKFAQPSSSLPPRPVAERKRRRDSDSETEESPERVDIADDEPKSFSAVVAATLPFAPSFSKDGTLSPAFFFFSTLFLANEHGLKLKSSAGPALDDLFIEAAPPPQPQ